MKKFIKENWFKIGILVAIFVLPYFLYYVPVIKPQIQLQKMFVDCNKKGMKFSENFKQKSIGMNPNIEYFVPPQFHFSKQMNACLSENGYVFPDHGGEGTYMQITNTDNNTQILRSSLNIYEQSNPSNNIVTYDEFMDQAKDIMFR